MTSKTNEAAVKAERKGSKEKESATDLVKKAKKLESDISAISEEIAKTESKLDKALFELDCDPRPEVQAKVSEIEKSISDLRQSKAQKERTLAIVREKSKAEQGLQEDERLRKAWREVKAITDARMELAKKIHEALAPIMMMQIEVEALGTKAFNLAPVKDSMGLSACPLSPLTAGGLLKRLFAKNGFHWAGDYGRGNETHLIPDYLPEFKAQHDWILKFSPIKSESDNEVLT